MIGSRIAFVLAGIASCVLPVAAADYTLRVEQGRVSLAARSAPVIRVLEDLGRKAGFEIVADIGEEVVVDASFESLTPEEAIKRICRPVGYLLVHDPATSRIRRVVLTPSRARASRTMPRQADPPGWRPPPPPPPVEADAEAEAEEAPDEGQDEEPEAAEEKPPEDGRD